MVSATLTGNVQKQIALSELVAELDRKIPLAAATFPGDPHIATRWRWRSKGINRGGRLIRLKTENCGGRVFTTQRWANEFIAACNADVVAPETPDDFNLRAKSENAALKAALG